MFGLPAVRSRDALRPPSVCFGLYAQVSNVSQPLLTGVDSQVSSTDGRNVIRT